MSNKLGVGALTAIVASTMVGAGIFSLPQNMAEGAGPAAVAFGWLITGIGMLCLVRIFYSLSIHRPDLDGGVIAYAKEGFGSFLGFTSAWGFWLNTLLANTSYAVVTFSAISYFTDTPDHICFGEGNTLPALIGSTLLIWIMHFMVLRGIKEAAMVNIVVTLAKLIPLLLFVGVVILAFNFQQFNSDIWVENTHSVGSFLDQLKSTMSITLWVFIGIEGAVVLSTRAKSRKAIGIATVIALVSALTLYILVTLLSYGVMPREEIAQLKNPSMALILEHIVGPWGAWVINLGLIVSVFGALLSWTVVTAEAPYIASKLKLFPKAFSKENNKGAASFALYASTIGLQICLITNYFNEGTYTILLGITTTTILIPYSLSAFFGLKTALENKCYQIIKHRNLDLLCGTVASIYTIWLVYAAGLNYLLLVSLIYFPGLIVYLISRKENNKPFFANKLEWIYFGILAIATIYASYLLSIGELTI